MALFTITELPPMCCIFLFEETDIRICSEVKFLTVFSCTRLKKNSFDQKTKYDNSFLLLLFNIIYTYVRNSRIIRRYL